MTLLELLVKELPKRGGWPEGAKVIVQNCDDGLVKTSVGIPHFDNPVWVASENYWGIYTEDIDGLKVSTDADTAIVTREQYESAIAAQQPSWNGEGLPPVGVNCEYKWQNDRWRTGKVCYLSKHTLLMMEIFDGEESESAYGIDDVTFRPIRTEADRKRGEAIDALISLGVFTRPVAEKTVDAIASGKIPGIELTK